MFGSSGSAVEEEAALEEELLSPLEDISSEELLSLLLELDSSFLAASSGVANAVQRRSSESRNAIFFIVEDPFSACRGGCPIKNRPSANF